jgi:hypothetical protein
MKMDCPFQIKITSMKIGQGIIKKCQQPVRVTGFVLEHACGPSVDSLIASKKRSGGYFGSIGLAKLKDTVEIAAFGRVITT